MDLLTAVVVFSYWVHLYSVELLETHVREMGLELELPQFTGRFVILDECRVLQ